MSARTVTILGATGSVGRATLDLIERAPQGAFDVVALTANSQSADLAELAIRTKAQFCAVADPEAGPALEAALQGTSIRSAAGPDAVCEAARMSADWVMAAIVGAAGLPPTLEAVRRGAAVAFANKEALVCAGDLFMTAAREAGARLLPVDSEHNAIFQAFDEKQRAGIRQIILTASGGPFRHWTLEQMGQASPAQAVAHPTWTMGAKISVDSATMMNKGLEIIEACHLFGLPQTDVDVLVHPESIVHGLVEYADGGMLAQLGMPDMRTPIAHALAWPDRLETPVERLDLAKLSQLTFEAPDPVRFPALDLARAAFDAGRGAPAIFNAANEVAVAAFLNGQIGFLDIAACVSDSLERGEADGVASVQPSDFEAVLDVDRQGRRLAMDAVKQRTR
ncbi:1-deoxy-D-xylulose-5-phosphate reductoisomerase [Oceanicaulis sp. UBA2681]|uniref:1-deoxy-D-xylulose-5-phosphate reductoisomerase n=1 Tax=Oceanicaulis sp. UBA2681 TaxID=1947007 RepID=UPI00257FB5CE|nr:1-deoxy-D-xylulose-5-phosphate reductoisomerase [Oceanicaulis sp. UBA2681]|tara:strand:- start:12872 stop:14053 length:1182 start_codon:yes stop_codon:yes gene_type:complete